LARKIKELDYIPVHIGTDSTVSFLKRGSIIDLSSNIPIFIASKTTSHFGDFLESLTYNPSLIFVEKGFSTQQEIDIAKTMSQGVPVYFLSQYRFSKVINEFINLKLGIKSIHYDWQVENHAAQEWLYHIISIDNYMKQTNNTLFINDYGNYELDKISTINIEKNIQRSCKIFLNTKDDQQYVIEIGKKSILMADSSILLEVENEDCLSYQLQEILIKKDTTRLERL